MSVHLFKITPLFNCSTAHHCSTVQHHICWSVQHHFSVKLFNITSLLICSTASLFSTVQHHVSLQLFNSTFLFNCSTSCHCLTAQLRSAVQHHICWSVQRYISVKLFKSKSLFNYSTSDVFWTGSSVHHVPAFIRAHLDGRWSSGIQMPIHFTFALWWQTLHDCSRNCTYVRGVQASWVNRKEVKHVWVRHLVKRMWAVKCQSVKECL